MAQHPKIRKIGEATPYLNLLLYGPSGAGKTTFAGSAKKVLFIDVEQGTTALAAQGRRDIDVWSISEFEEIWETYEHLRRNPADYDTVAIDSYTDLAAKGLEDVVTEAEERDPRRLTDAAELRDHGRVSLKLGKVLRRFRDLSINLILICTERDPSDRDPRTGPHIPESLAKQALGYMDMAGYMFLAEKPGEDGAVPSSERKLLFYSASGLFRVKDRFGLYTPETGRQGMTDPNFPQLLKEVHEKIVEMAAPNEKAPTKRKRPV